MRHRIVKNFNVEHSEIDGTIKETVDELQAGVIAAAYSPSPAEELVDSLLTENRQTPAFLVMTLRQGGINLFEIAFAKRIGLRNNLIRELLSHRDAEGTTIACRSADMDLENFHTLYQFIGDALNRDISLGEVEERVIGDMFRYTSCESAQILMRQALRERAATIIPLRQDAKIIPAKKSVPDLPFFLGLESLPLRRRRYFPEVQRGECLR